MRLKGALLQRCEQMIADNHDDMDSGLERDDYVSKTGMNAAYRDIIEFMRDFRDSDDDEDTLEELPENE